MARNPRTAGRNQAKIQDRAQTSKRNVAINKVEAYNDWIAKQKRKSRVKDSIRAIKRFGSTYGKITPDWIVEDEKNRRALTSALEELVQKFEAAIKEMVALQKAAKKNQIAAKKGKETAEIKKYKIFLGDLASSRSKIETQCKTLRDVKATISKPPPPAPTGTKPPMAYLEVTLILGALSIALAAFKLYEKLMQARKR